MKKNRHFFKKENGVTLIELLIAAFAGLICLAVISAVYIGGIKTYDLHKERAEAINKLWLNMDKIQREVRSGRYFIDPTSYEATYGITASGNPLTFKSNDMEDIAFYTPEGSSDLYKKVSSNTAEVFAPNITISTSVPVNPSSRSTTIILTTNWPYRDTTREESISSQISLRNWRTQW